MEKADSRAALPGGQRRRGKGLKVIACIIVMDWGCGMLWRERPCPSDDAK